MNKVLSRTVIKIFLSLVLSASLFSCGGGGGSGGGQTASTPPAPPEKSPLSAAAAGAWSNPATWGGVKPVEYQDVTIPAGMAVTLDENTPILKSLTIDGSLIFGQKDLELNTGQITVTGVMQVGTEAAPFTHRAVITLGPVPGAVPGGLDFTLSGGTLDLHGEARGPGWTRLAQTATAGTRQLLLQVAPAWRSGDRIVIASTDYDMNQAEEMTIASVAGNTVTLTAPLVYTHWGATESGVEERAEVGLLSRNIVVQGYAGSLSNGKGGHLLSMMGSTMRISGVEFTRMGRRGELARYPVHFHMMGDATGSYVKDSSLDHNFNRCVTVHETSNAVVSGNVAYDTFGHCYFFEDGIETKNLMENNLGLLTRTPAPADRVIPSDSVPATFWISNPDNVLRGNAAAGAETFGFWYNLPFNPTGPSATTTVFPQNTPLGEFSGNSAHSCFQGLRVDGYPVKAPYRPMAGGQAGASPVTATFLNFTAYKNSDRGAWTRGSNHVMQGARLADNLIGITLVGMNDYLGNSVIVGETANIGNPQPGEPLGLDGRTLPSPKKPHLHIRGFEFYDGQMAAENNTFINFQPNTLRHAGALSELRFNWSPYDPTNYAAATTLINANAVYFDPLASPDSSHPNDEDGHRSTLFIDKDGTVTATAGASVVVENPFLYDASCVDRPEWNARICPPALAFGQLVIHNLDSSAASITPLKVTRQDNGTIQSLAGNQSTDSIRRVFQTSCANKKTYFIQPTGAAPRTLRFAYKLRQPGDWIEVSIPYPYSTKPVINRDGNTAAPLAAAVSAAAFSASSGDVYYHDGMNLHLKLYINTGMGETIDEVSP